MSELRNANVQHCLDIMRDFHDVAAIDGDEELLEKKERADQALKQLSSMFSEGHADFRGDTCTKDAEAC